MARTEVTGKQIKDKSVSLVDDVVDVLPVANGGTGVATPGTSGYVLTSNGTAWVSAAAASGEVTLNGVETLYNKTISGASNTLSNIPVSGLSATGSPGSTTYLRGDGTWVDPMLLVVEIDGGSPSVTDTSFYDGGTVV